MMRQIRKSSHYLRCLFSLLFKPLCPFSLPVHIQLEPTNFCNMNCKMCWQKKVIAEPGHLEIKDFKTLIDSLPLHNLTFSGLGEPLLAPMFFRMVKEAKDKGVLVNTTTNGTLIAKRVDEILTSGLDFIRVSIDASTKETYYRIRGEDRFEEVIDGVERLIGLRNSFGLRKPYVRLEFCMQKENIEEIPVFVEFGHKLGADALYFQVLDLSYIEERRDILAEGLTYQVILKQLKTAGDISKRIGLPTNIPFLLKNFPLFWRKYSLKGELVSSRKCLHPWFTAYVTLSGDIQPCCAFAGSDIKLGNVFEHDFLQVWHNHEYQRLRSELREGRRPNKLCQNCIPLQPINFLSFAQVLPGFIIRKI